ncbi:MAG TPA: hypothetical protein VN900_15025 [Stellaceae bacterium]|nr:hypothetical protein [Stellaceae bacterium]
MMLLGELLVAQGLASNAEIKTALACQELFGGRIGEHLIALGIITKETLQSALRKQYELAKGVLAAEDLLAKFERMYGSGHSLTNRQRIRLASALSAAGRLAEALSLAQTALAGHDGAFGSEHPWTREAAEAMADLLAAQEFAASTGKSVQAPGKVAAASPRERSLAATRVGAEAILA